MIDAWLEPYCEAPEPEVYCHDCGEEAEINNNFKIECSFCQKCFDIIELDLDIDDYEDYA